MPQIPPNRHPSKLGSVSLFAVLLAFVLQVIYLPAHLVLEDHRSPLGACVRLQQHEDVVWHDHGDGLHRHGDEAAAIGHQHAGGSSDHEHDPEHDHGCQYFLQRLPQVQLRFFEPFELPLPQAEIVLSETQEWDCGEQVSERVASAIPARVNGSRGPPARV